MNKIIKILLMVICYLLIATKVKSETIYSYINYPWTNNYCQLVEEKNKANIGACLGENNMCIRTTMEDCLNGYVIPTVFLGYGSKCPPYSIKAGSVGTMKYYGELHMSKFRIPYNKYWFSSGYIDPDLIIEQFLLNRNLKPYLKTWRISNYKK